MIELFGSTYYMIAGGFSFFFMLFVLIILFLFLGKGTCRAFGAEWNRQKVILSMVLALFGNALLFSDVYRVGVQAKELCAVEGGFKIYNKAEVKNLRLPKQSSTDFIKKQLNRGFLSVEANFLDSYIERIKKKQGSYLYKENVVYRFYFNNGELKQIELPSYSKGPRFVKRRTNEMINKYIEKTTSSMVDAEGKVVYSKATFFSIYPGIVDSIIWGRLGFSFTPWFCGDKGYSLYKRSIFPKSG